MFDWMFEKEREVAIMIKVDDFHDWISKSDEIFRIINKHDTAKNRMRYRLYGFLRSGLKDEYYIDWGYANDNELQIMTIKCWPKALEEIRKLPWVV